MSDIKPYYRDDLIRLCRSLTFAARIPADPFHWTGYANGWMDFMEAFLTAVGCKVKDLFKGDQR